jgi:phosphoribosylformimino-5-aminoimidazole carboxamide ribotide isomerase
VIVYPAIDLRGGQCVRLREGDFAQETVYGDDPVAVARRWASQGAEWLHVVDLDGARAGRPVQLELVAAICRAVTIPVQVGGAIRDRDGVEAVLGAGVTRAIVGTVAVRDPDLCARLCRAFPGRIVVGIDARDGVARVSGWEEGSTVAATDLAATMANRGATAIVYTDIARDGTEQGPNVEETAKVARAAKIPVVASGGVGSLAHVRAVQARTADGIEGLIIGRALYTGAVTLRDALAAIDTSR